MGRNLELLYLFLEFVYLYMNACVSFYMSLFMLQSV